MLWRLFLANFLLILVCWTLLIKYIFPIAYALAYGSPAFEYVYWDFWPLVHVYLAWAIYKLPAHTLKLVILVSGLEIVIIISFFVLFLADPEWSIWRTNWFINKVFVLACFVLCMATALIRPDCFRRTVS